MKFTLLIITIIALPASLCEAAPRIWKNSNATRSFQGELVKREPDKITIRMTQNGRLVTVTPAQLHESDIEWLVKNHPFEDEKPEGAAPQVAAGCFYDTLAFGDDKATVIKKLKESPRFHSELSETFFARTGLNGTFHTTKGNEFFGMQSSLYYDWDSNHGLKHLSLYGHETAPAQVEASLVPTFIAMTGHISKHFGKGKSSAPKPQYSTLGESEINFTHAWAMETGGSLLLGVGKQDGKYVIVARFTREAH